VTITFERLGEVSTTGLSWAVNDDNQNLVAYDCSAGPGACTLGCSGQTFNQIAPPTTICEVSGFNVGETVTVTASSAPFDCPLPSGTAATDRLPSPADSSCQVVRFVCFAGAYEGKGTSTGSSHCVASFAVTGTNAVLGAAWTCGPADVTQPVSAGCPETTPPPPTTPTTTIPAPGATTTLPAGNPVLFFLNNLLDGFLPPSVQQRLRNLVLQSAAVAPQKGVLRGEATAGAVVVFKGEKRVRAPERITLRLKPTGAGKRLLRHSSSATLPLSVAVTFSEQGTKMTLSRPLTLSH
jgi:hypothetical protein